MNKQDYLKLIAPAIDLVEGKGEDYNQGAVTTLHAYFPFGDKSYVQMIYVKALRLVAMASSEAEPVYETNRDTLLDLINYCVFMLEYLENAYE